MTGPLGENRLLLRVVHKVKASGCSPLRQDAAWVDTRLAERILAQAPQADEGYFMVPDIPHEELE